MTIALSSSFAAALAAACTDVDTTEPGDVTGLADVEELAVQVTSQEPTRVEVTVQGNLNDACTEVDEITQNREGDLFRITIGTRRPADEICAQVLVPFIETIVLENASNLSPGGYVVEVNGVREEFEIPVEG